MRNILALIRYDLRKATDNVIAVILLFGVAVIPSFFGWFNVISSWNPFGNVKNMKVAVANADAGYKSDLFPMRINVGEQVVASLRANNDLNWVFTSEKGAVAGTKSGEYYAALVLPADFSRNMMTFYAPGAQRPEIRYYTNEKENALSPKITGEAATDVSSQINETFVKTLNQVGLGLMSSLTHFLEDGDTQVVLTHLQSSVRDVATQLHSAAKTTDLFTSLIASSQPIVSSAASLSTAAQDALQQSSGAIGTGADAARALRSTLSTATGSLSSAFAASAAGYQSLAKQVSALYGQLGGQSQQIVAGLNAFAGKVDAQITAYQSLRDSLQAQADAATDPLVAQGIELVVSRVDGVISRQQALRDRLTTAASQLADGNAAQQKTRDQVLALVNQAKQAVQSAQDTYSGTLKPQLNQLAGALSSVGGGISSMAGDLGNAASALTGGSGSLLGALTHAQGTTTAISKGLSATADRFDTLGTAIQKAQDSGDLTEVTKLIGSDPATLAGVLTQPVGLEQIAVFKVDSFGAQMAPFYTVLGLWVGALLLSVLIRVEVMRDEIPGVRSMTLTQEYIGRFGIFAIMSFVQSSLVYLGLMGFVGVRPMHPWLLLLAGWVMSFVFTLITYTLVVSFGEAGKAIAVFLLVVQISAGGGAYPLSVLPQWFQNISPFLPVTHATNAVRSAIAGIYQGDYWISLGWLALFIVPALLIGLALRLPLIVMNANLNRALESTKLM